MVAFLKKIFRVNGKPPERDFSAFFNNASKEEKTNLLRQVVREANADQKRLMEEAERSMEKKAART